MKKDTLAPSQTPLKQLGPSENALQKQHLREKKLAEALRINLLRRKGKKSSSAEEA